MLRYTATYPLREGAPLDIRFYDAAPEDGTTPTVLTIAAEGLRLEVATEEAPLAPLRPTRGSLSIVIEEGRNYSHLLSGKAYALTVKMSRGGVAEFAGYLSPEVLTAQWPAVGSILELSLVCPLEKLRGEHLDVTGEGFSTIRRLLWECLYPKGIAPLSSEYRVTWPMSQSAEAGDVSGGSVLELSVARALFYEKDTDAEGHEVLRGKPLYDVLADILRTLGLCLLFDNNRVRIFRPGHTKYRLTSINAQQLNLPAASAVEPAPLSTAGWRYLGEEHHTSRYRGARRCAVRAEHTRWSEDIFNLGDKNFAPVADENVFIHATEYNDGATAMRAYHNVSTDGTTRTFPNRPPSEWVSGAFIPDQGRYGVDNMSGNVRRYPHFTNNSVLGSFPAHAVRVYYDHALPAHHEFTPAIACVTNKHPSSQRDESQPLLRFRSDAPIVVSGGALYLTLGLGATKFDSYDLLAPVSDGRGKLKLFLRIGEYVYRGISWGHHPTMADTLVNAIEVPMVADNVDRGRAVAPVNFEHAEGFVGATQRMRPSRGGSFVLNARIAQKIAENKAAAIPLTYAAELPSGGRRKAYTYPDLNTGGYVEMSLYYVSNDDGARGSLGCMFLTDVGLSYREPDTSWGFSGEPKLRPFRTLSYDTATGQTDDPYELSLSLHSDHETARCAYSTILYNGRTLRKWYDGGTETTLESARLHDLVSHYDRVREYRDLQIEHTTTPPPVVGSLVEMDGKRWVVLSRSFLYTDGAVRLLLLDLPNP